LADKSRKAGRNAKSCERYKIAGKREISHARRVAKHLERHPADKTAVHYFNNLSVVTRKRAGVSADNVTPTSSKHKRIPPAFKGPGMGGKECQS
jgi:hypothetical protein